MGHSPNYASQTVTINIASGVVSAAAPHNLRKGDPIAFATTGALPTGLTAGTTYYVANTPSFSSTTFQVSATLGGAAIALSGTQSGVQTVAAPSGTYRVVRIMHTVTEQILTGQANAAAAKAAAKDPTQFNIAKNWRERRVMQIVGEDAFEYVVSAADDGT